MFLLDYIIIVTIFLSCFFGLLRGVYHEVMSVLFLSFNFYFFRQYNYFVNFFKNSILDTFLINNILILIMIIFFLLQNIF